jgi:DNA-binding MarR family transcriptional regulator
VLTGLERRNYLRRQAGPGATMQVRLTAKGWAVVEPIRRCVGEIEQEWIAQLGERRFLALRQTLHGLAHRIARSRAACRPSRAVAIADRARAS